MNLFEIFAPLWAARDWIPTLILLIFIFLPTIGQFISKLIEAQKEAARRAAQQAKKAAGPVGPPRDPIEQEIADFLRRVAGERPKPPQAAKPAPAPPPPPPPVQQPVRRPARSGQKSMRRPSAPQRPAPEPPIVAEVVHEAASEPAGVRRAEEFLRTDELQERAARLGTGVSRVDQELEARLREKFDRELQELGRLSTGLGDLSTSLPELPGDALGMEAMYGEGIPATAATGFASLLATADSVRNAIILYEILQPPWQRWSETRPG